MPNFNSCGWGIIGDSDGTSGVIKRYHGKNITMPDVFDGKGF